MEHKAFQPNKLILARQSRALSQSELAAKVAITQGMISKIEMGLKDVSDELLAKLCIELRYPRSFFFDPTDIYHAISYPRMRKGINKRFTEKVNADLNITAVHIQKLLESVEFVDNDIPYLDISEHESPEQIAKAIRILWRVPRGPIDNLTQLVESKGIIVVKIEFPSEQFDGFSLWMGNGQFVIFINKKTPGDRYRFTLAHELGHIIMHRIPTLEMDSEADRFAAELLMPKEDILYDLRILKLERLLFLKKRWKVSMQAIIYRAKELGTINDRYYRYLFTMIGKLGYRTSEPGGFEPERTRALDEMISFHIQELGYSINELAELLKMRINELVEKYLPFQTMGLIHPNLFDGENS